MSNLNIQPFGLGEPATESSADVLGGKGAGLVWMSNAGIPVPPGVVLPVSNYAEFCKDQKKFLAHVMDDLAPWLAKLRDKFGYMPLVSIRSGAPVSCPGMMDTILNVGLDTNTYPEWQVRLGEKAATDSFCRLIEMYGSVVRGITRSKFEGLDLQQRFELYKAEAHEEFPDAATQITNSIGSVFNSWNNERAKTYRSIHGIPESMGTACVVQAMVFGNLNDKSGTGVLFTRHPDTGEDKVVGEFLPCAQGEDVVAGIRTPLSLDKMHEWNAAVANELLELAEKAEGTRKDAQDMEFTVQDGKLYILQTRNAKRSAVAALRIALDLHKDGVLTEEQAKGLITARQYDLATGNVLDPAFTQKPKWTGIPACNGVVSGKVVRSAQAAIDCKEPCILVTWETCPDDIAGMNAAVGVLTMTGGATSHAAVVARSMDKPCVVGLGLKKDVMDKWLVEGKQVSLCGATGRVWLKKVPVISGTSGGLIREVEKLFFGKRRYKFDFPHPNCAILDLTDRLLEPVEALVADIKAQHKLTPTGVSVDLALTQEQEYFYAPFGKSFEEKVYYGIRKELGDLPNVTFSGKVPEQKHKLLEDYALPDYKEALPK